MQHKRLITVNGVRSVLWAGLITLVMLCSGLTYGSTALRGGLVTVWPPEPTGAAIYVGDKNTFTFKIRSEGETTIPSDEVGSFTAKVEKKNGDSYQEVTEGYISTDNDNGCEGGIPGFSGEPCEYTLAFTAKTAGEYRFVLSFLIKGNAEGGTSKGLFNITDYPKPTLEGPSIAASGGGTVVLPATTETKKLPIGGLLPIQYTITPAASAGTRGVYSIALRNGDETSTPLGADISGDKGCAPNQLPAGGGVCTLVVKNALLLDSNQLNLKLTINSAQSTELTSIGPYAASTYEPLTVTAPSAAESTLEVETEGDATTKGKTLQLKTYRFKYTLANASSENTFSAVKIGTWPTPAGNYRAEPQTVTPPIVKTDDVYVQQVDDSTDPQSCANSTPHSASCVLTGTYTPLMQRDAEHSITFPISFLVQVPAGASSSVVNIQTQKNLTLTLPATMPNDKALTVSLADSLAPILPTQTYVDANDAPNSGATGTIRVTNNIQAENIVTVSNITLALASASSADKALWNFTAPGLAEGLCSKPNDPLANGRSCDINFTYKPNTVNMTSQSWYGKNPYEPEINIAYQYKIGPANAVSTSQSLILSTRTYLKNQWNQLPAFNVAVQPAVNDFAIYQRHLIAATSEGVYVLSFDSDSNKVEWENISQGKITGITGVPVKPDLDATRLLVAGDTLFVGTNEKNGNTVGVYRIQSITEPQWHSVGKDAATNPSVQDITTLSFSPAAGVTPAILYAGTVNGLYSLSDPMQDNGTIEWLSESEVQGSPTEPWAVNMAILPQASNANEDLYIASSHPQGRAAYLYTKLPGSAWVKKPSLDPFDSPTYLRPTEPAYNAFAILERDGKKYIFLGHNGGGLRCQTATDLIANRDNNTDILSCRNGFSRGGTEVANPRIFSLVKFDNTVYAGTLCGVWKLQAPVDPVHKTPWEIVDTSGMSDYTACNTKNGNSYNSADEFKVLSLYAADATGSNSLAAGSLLKDSHALLFAGTSKGKVWMYIKG